VDCLSLNQLLTYSCSTGSHGKDCTVHVGRIRHSGGFSDAKYSLIKCLVYHPDTSSSPTKPNFGEQDSTPPIQDHHNEEIREARSSFGQHSNRANYIWFHEWFYALDFPRPIHKPGSTNLPSHSRGRHSRCRPRIHHHTRVRFYSTKNHLSLICIMPFFPSSAGMYMQEALELACRRSRLQSDPNDYALLLADMNILIPLDRTVASLQGKRELLLVKRSMLPQMGVDFIKGVGKTTDPNGITFPDRYLAGIN